MFAPANLSVIVGPNATGKNFTATAVFTISGNVGAAAATVTAGTATALSDTSGNYTLTGVPAGSYTLTPTKTGYAFTPVSRAVTSRTANLTAQNFTALGAGGAGTITNIYDAQGRLIEVRYSAGPTITYTYDAAGNRARVVTAGAPN